MKNTYLASSLAVLLIAFTTANVLASQSIFRPLMFRLVSLQDVSAAREFLGNLEGSAFYESQSQYLNSVFDNVLAQEIDTKHLNLEKNIAEYEKILALNPKNRDVLIKLALLYKDKRTLSARAEAKKHYQIAQEVDPWIKIEELEKL